MIKELYELPPKQSDTFSWYGPDMLLDESRWLIHLSPPEIWELEAAAEQLELSEKNIVTITASDFRLPTLAQKLSKLRVDLISGRGFALLRGLPIEKYSLREAGTIFYGLGCHLGNPRSQNAQGHLLGHVCDLGVASSNPNVRVYQTHERQTFHTDSSDVVGLMCIQPAKSGGISQLVSASTIFNEMREQRPDLLKLLLQSIATDRRGEIPPGMLPYFLIPVFNYFKGYLTTVYQRQYIDSAQRFADAPPLTKHHIEALNMFDALANSSELNFSMKLEKGDIQFVYNHALLHDRTEFEDFSDNAKKRHLLRLWLSVPGDRPLPEIFESRFGSIEPGKRGGIIVDNTKLHIPWIKPQLTSN